MHGRLRLRYGPGEQSLHDAQWMSAIEVGVPQEGPAQVCARQVLSV